MGRQHQEVGFTLLELMVAGACLLLLVAMMMQLLIPAFRISAKASTASELHQRGHHALKNLADDLQRTPAAGFAVYPTAPGRTLISLHQVIDADPTGAPVYADGLVIYLWQDRSLVRHRYVDPDPAFASSPRRLSVEQLETYLSAVVESRLLCSDLTSLSVSDSDPDPKRLRQPLLIAMELTRGEESQLQRLALSEKVTMRNR